MKRKYISKDINLKPKQIFTNYGVPELTLKDKDSPLLIDELITYLNKAKEHGANFIRFSGETDPDSYTDLQHLEIKPIIYELEPEADFKKRVDTQIKKEADQLKEKERAEMAEYERLRLKFDIKKKL